MQIGARTSLRGVFKTCSVFGTPHFFQIVGGLVAKSDLKRGMTDQTPKKGVPNNKRIRKMGPFWSPTLGLIFGPPHRVPPCTNHFQRTRGIFKTRVFETPPSYPSCWVFGLSLSLSLSPAPRPSPPPPPFKLFNHTLLCAPLPRLLLSHSCRKVAQQHSHSWRPGA